MKLSKKSLALAAAFAGLVGGTAARAAQPFPTGSTELSAGMLADDQGKKKEIEKHACKGMNSCKGQGGGDAKHWARTRARARVPARPTAPNRRCRSKAWGSAALGFRSLRQNETLGLG